MKAFAKLVSFVMRGRARRSENPEGGPQNKWGTGYGELWAYPQRAHGREAGAIKSTAACLALAGNRWDSCLPMLSGRVHEGEGQFPRMPLEKTHSCGTL